MLWSERRRLAGVSLSGVSEVGPPPSEGSSSSRPRDRWCQPTAVLQLGRETGLAAEGALGPAWHAPACPVRAFLTVRAIPDHVGCCLSSRSSSKSLLFLPRYFFCQRARSIVRHRTLLLVWSSPVLIQSSRLLLLLYLESR